MAGREHDDRRERRLEAGIFTNDARLVEEAFDRSAIEEMTELKLLATTGGRR